MAQPSFPIYPTSATLNTFPNPKMIIRSRRETDTHDAINARQFEHWQTDGKYGTHNRPDLNSQVPFHDVLPIDSRMNTQNYSSQPRFDQTMHRGGQNSYFDKYDTAYDARNMVRELRATVYEDKNIDYSNESKHLLERNFDNRWLDTSQINKSINASEDLRIKMDNIRTFYK
jgi:hypothetical protein